MRVFEEHGPMDVARVLQCLLAESQPRGPDDEWIHLVSAGRAVCAHLVVEGDDVSPVILTEQHAVTGIRLAYQRLHCTQCIGLGPIQLHRIIAVEDPQIAVADQGAARPPRDVHPLFSERCNEAYAWMLEES